MTEVSALPDLPTLAPDEPADPVAAPAAVAKDGTAPPPAPPATPAPPTPVLQLDYADRSLRRQRIPWWWALVAVRRLVFTVGVAVFCAGVAQGLSHDDTTFLAVGWGAGLVALVIPFPALSRRPGSPRSD